MAFLDEIQVARLFGGHVHQLDQAARALLQAAEHPLSLIHIWVRDVVVTAIELLSGIPSVVFGLLGMQVLVPAVAKTFGKRCV